MINNLLTILNALAHAWFIPCILLIVTLFVAWVFQVEKRGGWRK